jgi:thiol-disulfide isomerase/thioredoxin
MEWVRAPEVRGKVTAEVALRRRGALAGLAVAVLAAPAGAAELLQWDGGAQPALTLDVLDGGPMAVAAAPGDLLVVHFFATWCPPCVPELAALDGLAERRAGSALQIVAIDVAEVDARVRRFLADRPLGLPVLMDRDRSAARAWGVVALPTSFIVVAGTTPAYAAEGEVDWDSAEVGALLDALLAPPGHDIEGGSDAPT